MLKINPLSTLYVGIDVSSKSNYVCALDFFKNKYINSSFANNQPGAEELALKILECLNQHPDLTILVEMKWIIINLFQNPEQSALLLSQ